MKRRNYGMLALSLGLAFGIAVPALAVSDRVETQKTNMYRGVDNGQPGTWVEYTKRTYRYADDPVMVAVRDAFKAIYGREPNQAEFDQWYNALKNGSAANINAYRDQIIALYQSLLGRAPNATELLNALSRMIGGTPYATIYNEIYAQSTIARVQNNFPGFPFTQAEMAKIATLSDATLNSIKPPAGYPGESVYPAGLYGRDAATWQGLFDGGWSWTDRNSLVSAALGGKAVPTRSYNLDELMNFVDWVSDDWWQNNTMSSLVNTLGGVYQVIRTGSNPKIAVTFQPSPGAQVTRGLMWEGNTYQIIDQEFPSGLDKTVGWFMSEGDRYQDMYKAFISVGATAAAAEAKRRAEDVMAMLAGVVSDPLVLDLNANGKIDVTGNSTAKIRNQENKAMVKTASAMFDLFQTGKAIRTEWIKDGDALLVDDTKGQVSQAIKSGKPLTGAHLFGDVDGYTGGFFKLMAMDQESKQASLQTKLTKGFGVLTGKELDGLKVWIDNGDGVATANELKSLSEVGITEIGLRPQMVKDAKGELNEQSYFIRNGQKFLIQEVWFAHE